MPRKFIASFFVICICIVTGTECAALDPGKAVTQYMIDCWNDETGLPQNTVRTILQTSDGYLWLGTEEGLARFDGVKFTVFDQANTPAIKDNFIFHLFEDSRKDLWIGTRDGLLRYRNGKFKRFTEEDGFTRKLVQMICEDLESNLWMATDGEGLFKYDVKGNRFIAYTVDDGLPYKSIRSVFYDSKGNLWVGASRGLLCFNDGKFIEHSGDFGDGEDIVTTFAVICEDSSHRLWFGTDRGLYLKTGDRFVRTEADVALGRFNAIYEDKQNNLWLGTESGGLIRYANGKFSPLTKEDGLSDSNVLSITADREGNLWVGTAYSGLNRLKDGKFTTFTKKEGLVEDIVFPIYEDSKGFLWFGTTNGLSRYKDGRVKHFTTKDGLLHNSIDSLYEDQQGMLWVGTDDGLSQMKPHGPGLAKVADYLPDQYILGLFGDKNQNIWAGTLQGLGKVRGGTSSLLTDEDGLGSRVINYIIEDSKGNLWISTCRSGLTRYRDGVFTVFTQEHGLASDSLQCIYEDRDGVLWLGSSSGLNRFKDETFASFTKKEGLLDNNIFQVLEDGLGYLWMSSNKGIFRVPKKELNEVAEGKRERVTYMAFGKDDGMPTNECNGGVQPAGCRTRDGRLWFPTPKGAVTIDPANIPINEIIPPVLIEAVLLDGTPANLDRPVTVGPEVKRLQFHFTTLSFTDAPKNKFKYMLDGYDEEWIDAANLRSAWYTNLDGGDYSFKVIACNNDGKWNEQGAAIGITVIPPFWRTWWFTVIALFLFAAFSYLVINFSRKYIAMTSFWKRQKYIGKFKLLDKIGAGGMGTVYKASNLMDKQQTVAIKVLRDDLFDDQSNIKRFKQEAAIIDQLDHPNVVKVIERGQSKDNLFIAMEFLEGKTLTQKISERKRLPLNEAVHIMVQVADALAKIHSKNIIHRDLKPDNIMLIEKDGDPNFVKILDFGLAKTQFQTRLTQTGMVIGTINYLSPEQIGGRGAYTASDIYALGIIFYEMITGEKPFMGDTTINIMKQILDKTPIEPIRFRFDMSFELNDLIMHMLNKKNEQRPAVKEIVEQLRIINFNLLKAAGS